MSYTWRDIIKETPSVEELEQWLQLGDHPLSSFFNSRGRKYKELNLKERLKELPEREQLEILASDGFLVKRPLFIGEDFVLIGFDPEEWEQNLL